ncbi:MAG: beta-propeller fold lactonase family protein, partial [Oscillospiraceae bacterium]|nr:beta-propeller fold lactonase family protein [Oscillospiraceae bacterium]
ENGTLTPINVISSLADDVPTGKTPETREYIHGEYVDVPADGFMPLEQQGFVIHPNGKWIYDMLNGADAVSVLSIDQESGKLSLAQTKPVDGRWVRGCAISPDGRFLIVTCLQSGDVYSFPIGEDGLLGDAVSHVVCPGGSYVTFFET